MKKFILLENDGIIKAVELYTEHQEDDVVVLLQQGFSVCCGEIDAESKDDAINRYLASASGDDLIPISQVKTPLTLYNLLLFKTNTMNRLYYFGICILVGGAAGVMVVNLMDSIRGFYGNSENTSILISLCLVVFFAFWISISASVARWKNIGHKGLTYILVLFITICLDLVLMGVAGLIFSLYLISAPESYIHTQNNNNKKGSVNGFNA